ncbi:hypothetical protein KJY77_06470 [Canibacter sp. lx-72]|nr:hypothetical protein [Canibacter zhuwentaonis]
MALIGNIVIPILCFAFFVLPNSTITENAELSAESTLQLVAMISMSTSLFGFSTAIAQDKQDGFADYLKSLPYGLKPRVYAHIIGVTVITLLGIVILIACSVITTSFTIDINLLLRRLVCC